LLLPGGRGFNINWLGKEPLLIDDDHRDLVTEEAMSISWKDGGPTDELNVVPPNPPSHVAFLVATEDEVLLAMGYRAHPILIWNALELQLLGSCEPDIPNNGINAMVFGPNPEVPVLVVSFQEGSLCVFDYVTMEMLVRQPHVYAMSLSFSSDGRTFISGNNQGAIEVFELEPAHNGATATLNIIYRTNHPLDGSIRGVVFSVDGFRFVDVRGRQGRVWAPAALVRKGISELESSIGSSEAEAALIMAPNKPSRSMLDGLGDPEITSPLVPSADGKVVLAGKRNGDVVLFSTSDARQIGVLYQHGPGTSIVCLALAGSQNRVVSADNGGRVVVAELEVPLPALSAMAELKRASLVLDRNFGAAVTSVLVNASGNRVLICSRYTTQLWQIPSGMAFLVGGAVDVASDHLTPPGLSLPPRPVSPVPRTSPSDRDWIKAPGLRAVFQHPSKPEWFISVTGDIARVYMWDDFTEVTSPDGIRLERELSPVPSGASWETATASYHVGSGFVVELFRPSSSSSPRLCLWPAAEFDPSSASRVAQSAIEPNLEAVSPAVLAVLGIAGPSTLLFLDVKLWVCSTELQSVNPTPSTSVIPIRSGGFSKRSTLSTSTTSLASASTASFSSSSRLSLSSTSSAVVQPTVHAKRHFFALSEWRTRTGELRCAVAASPAPPGRGGSGARDVLAFAAGPRVVVVQGGLEFSESVAVWSPHGDSAELHATAGELGGSRFAGQNLWHVVAGSMHRRSSNW
jgi:hypothetical protein